MKTQLKKYITLGAGHGINDCIAGYIIGSLFYTGLAPLELGLYTILYNLLAFGGQLIFARIIEAHFLPRQYLAGSFILLAASLAFLNLAPSIAILFGGIASAVIHVTGGVESTRRDDKSFGIGIFASPGIIGLVGGGVLAYLRIDFIITGIILSLAYLIFLMMFYKPSAAFEKPVKQEAAIEGHDIAMVILITIISLRSFIWDVIQMVEQKNYNSLLIIATAAMCGKIAGGFIADRIGHKKFVIWALGLSVPFLIVFKRSVITLSIGAFLLQSTIPATTVMILQLVRSKPAFGIAMSFGISVLIAISLFYTPVIQYLDNTIVAVVAVLISIMLMMWYGRWRRNMEVK